jgi:hypothetical protein
VELMIVVAVLGLLLAMAGPAYWKYRTNARRGLCLENLNQIESAKQRWGLEKSKSDGDIPTQADLIGPFLYLRRMPECPGGGAYTIRAIGLNALCSEPGHSL